MNAMDWFFLFLAIVVGGGILFYVITPSAPASQFQLPALTLSFPPSASINDTIEGTITGFHLKDRNILFFDGTDAQTFPCSADPCIITHTIAYSTPGARTLEVRADILRAEQRITILNSQRVCIDGTVEGECATPPLRCVNAALVSDCSVCGCPTGLVCQSPACVVPHVNFDLGPLTFEGTIYSTSAATFFSAVIPDAAFPVSGTYVFILDEYASGPTPIHSTPHTIQLTAIPPGQPYVISVSQLLSPSTQSVDGKWYAQGSVYDDSTLLARTPPIFIKVNEDSTPPQAPSGLAYHVNGNSITLTWNPSPSPDAKTYHIYQQTSATGGFTTYAVLANVSTLEYSLARPDQDTAFVVRALDAAGNESPASNPLVVPAS